MPPRRAPCQLSILLCEPLPEVASRLQRGAAYRYFRAIYAAFQAFQAQLAREAAAVHLRVTLLHKPADIVGLLRREPASGGLCCVIFGPNFPNLSKALVRTTAIHGGRRLVAVCHNPATAGLSGEQLDEMTGSLGLRACGMGLSDEQLRCFWHDFFERDLRSVIATRVAEPHAAGTAVAVAAPGAHAPLDDPGDDGPLAFPARWTQLLEGVEHGDDYDAIATAVRHDRELTALILRASGDARHEGAAVTCTVPTALALIGPAGIRRMVMVRAFEGLLQGAALTGPEGPALLRHSLCAGLVAQVASLNMVTPSRLERSTLKSLRLQPAAGDALTALRLWERFPQSGAVDPFTVGLFHDVGKLVNAIRRPAAHRDLVRAVQRDAWQSSLLSVEAAVLGEQSHPAIGGRLLAAWGFRPLAETVTKHHAIGLGSAPGVVLAALANLVAKGSFPSVTRVGATAGPPAATGQESSEGDRTAWATNPLPAQFGQLTRCYRAPPAAGGRVQLGLAAAERAVRADGNTYLMSLLRQSPDVLDVADWLGLTVNRLIALSLVLNDTLHDRVRELSRRCSAAGASRPGSGRTTATAAEPWRPRRRRRRRTASATQTVRG